MTSSRSFVPGASRTAPARPSAPSALSAALALAFGAGLAVHDPATAVPVTLFAADLRATASTDGLGDTNLDCTAASTPGSSPATVTCLPPGNISGLLPLAQSSARAGVDWGLQVAGQSRSSSVTSTAGFQTSFNNTTASDTLRFSYRYLIGAGSLELGTGFGLNDIRTSMEARASLSSRIRVTVAGAGAVTTSVDGEVGIVFTESGPDTVTKTGSFTDPSGPLDVTIGPSSVSWSDTVFSIPILLDLLPGQSFMLTHDLVGSATSSEPTGYCCSGSRCSATYSGAQQSLGNIGALALGLTYERLTGGNPGGGPGGQVLLPGTLLLGAAGLAGMGLVRRRRR
jgi:hypothetical protein